jgi:ABC-type tungstate transport system permease subunit
MMENLETSKKLDRITYLLAANLLVMAIGAGGLVIGLLPKLERVTHTTERVEQRFQAFADEVQPVVSAGAGKAIESIKKIDADLLSKTATERSDELIRAASEKAKRYLNRDKKEGNE